MVRPEVIRKRLNSSREYIRILEGLQRLTYDEFVADPLNYGSAERFLHLVIESLTDMGNHVIADGDLGIVNAYRDIPSHLANAGYITREMQEQWISMIGFRNVLIHDYLDIDRRIVYDILQNRLNDLKSLQKTFAAFL